MRCLIGTKIYAGAEWLKLERGAGRNVVGSMASTRRIFRPVLIKNNQYFRVQNRHKKIEDIVHFIRVGLDKLIE